MLIVIARSYYAGRGVPGDLDIYHETDGSPWPAQDSSSTAVSIESQTASGSLGEAVNLENHQGNP